MSGGDRSWDTEDKLHLLIKTPDFGTTVLGQFWAICREPGSLVYTLPPGITTPICDLGCAFVDSLKTLEIVPRIFSHKAPFQHPSCSKGANREGNTTMLSRTLQGKFISSSLTPFLAHITVSLDLVFFCESVSPITSEFPAGREWVISTFLSPRGLTVRPINLLELDRVVTEPPRSHKGPLDLTPQRRDHLWGTEPLPHT